MATENKNLSSYHKEELPEMAGKVIGIITSEWNQQITGNMRSGAT